MPNFLLLGTAKAGTTSLYRYLEQHPHVFMSPVKEPKYFACDGERPAFRGPRDASGINREAIVERAAYEALFAGANGARALGEATPWYLYSPTAAERIRSEIPHARLIAILREPAERAYSHFLHHVRDGREPLRDFVAAIEAEDERIAKGWAWHWHYVRAGFYAEQIERFLRAFPRDQLRIFLHEDLAADSEAVVRDVFAFLGLDADAEVDTRDRVNASGIPRIGAVQAISNRTPKALKRVFREAAPASVRRAVTAIKHRNLVKPEMPSSARRYLRDVYREDVRRLQDLIGRDLSQWS